MPIKSQSVVQIDHKETKKKKKRTKQQQKISLASSDTWNSVLCIVVSEYLPNWNGLTRAIFLLKQLAKLSKLPPSSLDTFYSLIHPK